jgi:hypothetical protein
MHKHFKVADVADRCMKQQVEKVSLIAKEVSPVEIHRCLNSLFGELTIDVSTVRHWVRHFNSDETEIRDKL